MSAMILDNNTDHVNFIFEIVLSVDCNNLGSMVGQQLRFAWLSSFDRQVSFKRAVFDSSFIAEGVLWWLCPFVRKCNSFVFQSDLGFCFKSQKFGFEWMCSIESHKFGESSSILSEFTGTEFVTMSTARRCSSSRYCFSSSSNSACVGS